MSGIQDFNFPAFMAAAAQLRLEGHEVFNPAEEDLKDFGTLENVTQQYNANTAQMKRHVMRKDLLALLDWAEVIALLPRWELSHGAKAELALAKFLGLTEIYL